MHVTPSGRSCPGDAVEPDVTDNGDHVQLQTILRSHADQLHVEELADLVEEALTCAASCRACADACLDEEADLTRCIRANLDCADICVATANVAGRAGTSGAPWLDQVEVCLQACASCAEECEQHHSMEHCRLCEEACRRCEQACQRLLDVIR